MLQVRFAVATGMLVASALLAPAAQAGVEGLVRTEPRAVTELSFAGEAVVWADLSPYRLRAPRRWTVRSVRRGEAPRTRLERVVPWDAERPSLAAAATQLAVALPTRSQDGVAATELLAGPLEGPLAVLARSVYSFRELHWSGTRLTTWEGAVVAVRDADAGFAVTLLRDDAPNVVGVRIAGRRVAIATATYPGPSVGEFTPAEVRIDVIRLDDRQAEYGVTAHGVGQFDFDLQEDGKLLWLQDEYDRSTGLWTSGTLSWASPADARPQVLARGVATEAVRPRLVGDRVVFARPAGGWSAQPIYRPWVIDLAGRGGPIWFPLPGPLHSDFDGARLAIAAAGCVWLGDVGERLAGPPAGTCPQQVTGEGRRRVTRGGSRYSYGIHCLMAPVGGCRGTARLEAARREGGPPTIVAVRRFRAGRGRATTIRFAVARARLRALANKRGTVILTVRVRSTDAAGLTSVTAGSAFRARP